MTALPKAPELEVSYWLNTNTPITLEPLRGRIVVIEAFQLLCPGCVQHGLPQAMRIAETFSRDDVAVLGLHSVFEHHAAQARRDVLEAFLHENRITFPVGADTPGTGDIPRTMAAYALRGTPSTVLIDAEGRLAGSHFGRPGDMRLGAEIMHLVERSRARRLAINPDEMAAAYSDGAGQCSDEGCVVGRANEAGRTTE